MTAQILGLIDKQDTVEIARDAIAAILLEESAQQQSLASAAEKDPNLWKLRVFVERSNPWTEWLASPPQTDADAVPIVAVNFDQVTFDKGKSDIFADFQGPARFNIDVFGYGKSTETESGHTPGDEKASAEAMRGSRLVRNILMSPYYAELGYPSLISQRFVDSIQRFPPELFGEHANNVVGFRLTMTVDVLEQTGQIAGQPCEGFTLTVKRTETGETLLTIKTEL